MLLIFNFHVKLSINLLVALSLQLSKHKTDHLPSASSVVCSLCHDCVLFLAAHEEIALDLSFFQSMLLTVMSRFMVNCVKYFKREER